MGITFRPCQILNCLSSVGIVEPRGECLIHSLSLSLYISLFLLLRFENVLCVYGCNNQEMSRVKIMEVKWEKEERLGS